MGEYRRKTLRSFYCEGDLWKAYDQLAREQDTTIDQLLNDALRRALEGAPMEPAGEATKRTREVTGSAPTTAMPALAPRAAAPDPDAVGSGERRGSPPPPPGAAPARPGPPPAPAGAPAPAENQSARPMLYLHADGRMVPVQQDRFVIGRGSKGTDFTIRDANISRKHAVVLWHEGAFYIQDLGSTNGVEFQGERIENKQIEEGDCFLICEHELNFSYRG